MGCAIHNRCSSAFAQVSPSQQQEPAMEVIVLVPIRFMMSMTLMMLVDIRLTLVMDIRRTVTMMSSCRSSWRGRTKREAETR